MSARRNSRLQAGGLTIHNKTKVNDAPAQSGGEGIARHLKAGAASGLAAGFILAYIECLWLLVSLGPFSVGLTFFIRAVGLYGLVGGLLGFMLSSLFFRILKAKQRVSENIGALYFSIFLGAGIFAEIFFYLMDIYPFGGRNKYSLGTLARAAAAVVVSAAAAMGVYRLSKKILSFLQKSGIRRAAGALFLLGFCLASFAALRQAGIHWESKAVRTKQIRREAAGPNVLFILVDSLRSDHLSCYGYPFLTSPHLDALAAQGVQFSSVLAASTWTVPTHASLFTGLYPSSHGAYSLFSTLDRGIPTLAQTLSRNGYYTLSLYSNPLLGSTFGLKNVFDHALGIEHDQKTSLTLIRLYQKFIRKTPPSEEILDFTRDWAAHCRKLSLPYFIFMNLCDVHEPFGPKEPYFSEFTKSLDKKAVNIPRVETLVRFTKSRKGRFELLSRMTELDLLYLVGMYDSAIRYEDERIGVLIDRLKAGGLLDNTLIVITADHGDFLGEHGRLGHVSEKLYNPVLKIPLILWSPDKLRPRLVRESVSQVDIFPTLLSILGLKNQTPPGIQGRDVLSEGPPAEVLCEFWDDVKKSFVRALYAEPWKLISPPDGNLELYDLAHDPGERTNLVSIQPDLARELNDRLMTKIQSQRQRPPSVDDNKKREMRDLLRTLGYIDR